MRRDRPYGNYGRREITTEVRAERSRLLPAFLVADVVLAVWYITWLLSPSHAGTRWLWVLLVVAEVFNLVRAAGFWWTVYRAKTVATPRWFGAPPRVDVLIPTYDEAIDVVEPTLDAAMAMRGAKVTVHLLDDGARDEMAELAARHGARYVSRAEHTGAKAGNINHALARCDAPLVAIFDCDHVPDAGFFPATIGHLHDPLVAFVQTPQSYANRDAGPVAAAAGDQQDLFYGVVARGRNVGGAMVCCGTNVVLRRAAIDDVGGFPEDSLTEDFELSLRLHERGWSSAYVPEVLARGLGPEDMASYVAQQARWAQGCLSAVPRILFGRLPWRLRVQYLLAASYFVSGVAMVLYLSLPMLRIFAHVQPVRHGAAALFLLHFVPYFAASVLTVALASEGRYSFGAYSLGVSSFWVHLLAAGRVLTGKKGRFVVTPKHGYAAPQLRAVWPALGFAGVLVVSIGYALVNSRGPTAMTNVGFALFYVVLLVSGAWDAIAGAPRSAGRVDPRTETATASAPPELVARHASLAGVAKSRVPGSNVEVPG